MSFLTAGKHHLRQAVKVALNYQGRRGCTIRQEIFDLISPHTPSVARAADGIWYYVNTMDHHVGRIVFGLGSYEQDVMAHTLQLAGKHAGPSRLLDDRIFIDIGPNLGTSTIPAIKIFGASETVCIDSTGRTTSSSGAT